MEGRGFDLRNEAHLRTLTEDVVESSEIEGEKLSPDQVRSSIARRLGLDVAGLVPADRNVDGVVEMMLDATSKYQEPLTEDRLFAWHAAIFPTGHSGMSKINAGAWRQDEGGPMQIGSGPMGKDKVHYEAPPAERVPDEMKQFLAWFGDSGDTDLLLAAGLAHLWFVTIHPLDDGNGRIARAIADMALARSDRSGQGAHETLSAVLNKARFWERFAKEPLNERQIKILNRVMDGFEGKLTSSKWARIAKCSPDTALRDITDLVVRGALRKDPGGGRSTSYSITAITDK